MLILMYIDLNFQCTYNQDFFANSRQKTPVIRIGELEPTLSLINLRYENAPFVIEADYEIPKNSNQLHQKTQMFDLKKNCNIFYHCSVS